MRYKLINDKYIIKLERGEKVISSLMDFCAENRIIFAYFFGIGTVSRLELAHYTLDTKQYSYRTIEKPLEVCSLVGNITLLDGKIAVHSHIVVSDSNMQPLGGHLKEAEVAATCEIFLKRVNSEVDRKYSEELGLNILDF